MRKSPTGTWSGAIDRERPFTPPTSSAGSWLWVLLLVAGLGAAAGLGYQRWSGQSLQWPWHRLSANMPAPVPSVEPKAAASDDAVPKAAASPAVDDAPARVNAAAPAKVLRSTGMTDSSAPSRSESHRPSTVTVYRCKSYQGGLFWSTSHCRDHRALVDRMENVPASLSPPLRIEVARNQAQSREGAARQVLVAEQRAARANQREVNAADGECEAIKQAVARIDAEARQPLSAARQDRLRQQRQLLRSRQFELRC